MGIRRQATKWFVRCQRYFRRVLSSSRIRYVQRRIEQSTLVSIVGLTFLGVLALYPGSRTSAPSTIIASIAVLAFGTAAMSVGRSVTCVSDLVMDAKSREALVRRSTGKVGVLAIAIVSVLASVVTQTRFIPGTVIAWGDQQPPEGSAWLTHMFSVWAGTGTNLGGPANGEVNLPWAFVVELVRSIGGTSATAQRVWISFLVVLIAVSATWLLLNLRMSGLASVGGGLLYAFSPFLLTNSVVMSPIWLAAIALLPLLIAFGVKISRVDKIPLGWWLFPVLVAPLVGYTFQTPFLTGFTIVGFMATPMLVVFMFGRSMLGACIRRVSIAGVLLLLASAYWLIPSIIQIGTSGLNIGLIASKSWIGTETRATLANVMWLNYTPFWHQPFAYPFSGPYSVLPLSVLRYGLPITAFLPFLLLQRFGSRDYRFSLRARIASFFGIWAVVGLVIATGTNFPGSLIMSLVYRLPQSWVFQRPYHSLYFVALAYSVLTALMLDLLVEWLDARNRRIVQLAKEPATRVRRYIRNGLLHINGMYVAIAVLIVLMVPSYPLLSGAVIANHVEPGGPTYPPSHVTFPSYWKSIESYLNSSATPGAVLVLPPYSYYEVPRSWYYGNTGFIQAGINRPVLYPASETSSGGYLANNSTLASFSSLFAANLLHGNMLEAKRLLGAAGIRYVLVSGDVVSPFPGRLLGNIYSPARIDSALALAPGFRLAIRRGPLSVFAFNRSNKSYSVGNTKTWGAFDGIYSNRQIVAVDQYGSGLQALGAFRSPHAFIDSSVSLPGVPVLRVYSAKSGNYASGVVNSITGSATLQPKHRFEVALLSSHVGSGLNEFRALRTGKEVDLGHDVTAEVVSHQGHIALHYQYRLRPVGSGPSFSSRYWAFGNCAVSLGRTGVGHRLLPNGGPSKASALVLTSLHGSSCAADYFARQPSLSARVIYLSVWLRHIKGALPRLCLWESAPGECAQLPKVPSSAHWVHYTSVVSVPPLSGSLALFVYGDSPALARGMGESISRGVRETVNEYSRVNVSFVPSVKLALLSSPRVSGSSGREYLGVVPSTYSLDWSIPKPAQHVKVNGFENGWIVSHIKELRSPNYQPTWLVRLGEFISIAIGLLVVSAMVLKVASGSVVRRRRHGAS